MTAARKVLLLSVNAGAGHIRAAKAIEEQVRLHSPDGEVRHLEVLEYTNAIYRHGFSSVYGAMIRRSPSIWRRIYEQTELQSPQSGFKSLSAAINQLASRRLQREVERFDPDVIVCTHFIPAGIMAAARRRGALRAAVCVVLTDFAVHPMWIHAGVGQYFVATPEMAFTLKESGIGSAQIDVSGIPLLSPFASTFPEKKELRRRLNLDPDRPTALISGGGCGLGALDTMVKGLADNFPDAQFQAVAGKNSVLYDALKKIAKSSPRGVIPYPFVWNMHELMAASDFVITKPGGLTSAECLALQLPMILVNPIPGQEERNASYLLESGAALCARFMPNLIHKAGLLLCDPELRRRMSLAGKAIARPAAAEQVALAALAMQVPAAAANSTRSSPQVLATAAT